MTHSRTRGAAVITLLCAVSCGGSSEQQSAGTVSRSWNPATLKEVRDVPVVAIRASLLHQLTRKPATATDEQWDHVKRLYRGYRNAPLWMDEDGLIEKRAEALVDAIVNATSDAIQVDQYPLLELARTLDTLRRTENPTPHQLAAADLLLSTSYVALGEDYLVGQIDPRSVGQNWHINPEEQAVDSALTRSLREEDLAGAIGRMRPQDEDYALLRQKLADFRKIVSEGGWPAIPEGSSLRRGERADSARLHAIRSRLRAEGIDVGDADGAAAHNYDHALAAAIAQFQERHVIAVDSQLGKETLDAMNVPATDRLAQIAASLERFRWMPRAFGSKYISVNVPAFRLEGYENGRKTIEMKVIVGAEYEGRATPVFSDSMDHVIFRPYWDVPPRIAANEFTGVPSGYVIRMRSGRPHLRQLPGPKNALGLVKFMFPNDFGVYLHDTPNGALFTKDVRAFSHGCIRLEQPAKLAEWVLGWDESRVRAAMEGRNNRTVVLPSKIPVYISYFTTYVRDGELWYANDLYGRDDDLLRVVAGGALPSGSVARGIEALRKLTD